MEAFKLQYEIRWHGRGGQGVVTASRLLAQAAMDEGKHVQAFPEFGPERTGAPIRGFTRISDEKIRIHSQIYNPDMVVVLDPTLLETIDIGYGLIDGGKLVINTDLNSNDLNIKLKIKNAKTYTVDATRIALDVLGKPITNTAMLGAVVKAEPLIKLESICKSVSERFAGAIGEKNVDAIKKAYEEVTE
jgi:2-oxoisovalerate ferredoxin oxidoreductase gamma subunit